MSEITIIRQDTETGGALIARRSDKDGKAEMTFSSTGPTLRIVDHTEVDEGLHGTGAGVALAERMVEEARKDGVKLIPLCPFFLATARKHPEWQEIVRMP